MTTATARLDAPRDLLVIGGGVNGCGIARDAVGRGLSVTLCEQNDLAQATSSASTKLFHGGLRYLEYYEFRLVRESLIERETLLKAMPHIAWPLRFVLPHHKGLRSAWLLRLGLFIYDNLGGRKILPPTKTLKLRSDPTGAPLKDAFEKGFEYSDCWVQDSQLVVLNARDAADRGAEILPRTRFAKAHRADGLWHVTLEDTETGATREITARALVNAGGPWVDRIIKGIGVETQDRIRLVRGSHIVVRQVFEHDRAYIFQNADKRIIFAIPYENDFTLIGTTDQEHTGKPSEVVCTPEEAAYLCAAASEYFAQPITTDDIVHTYSGVRPLYDDGAKSATAATRDYVLKVEDDGSEGGGKAPLLNIFGGKITTFRRLAESAMDQLKPYFPAMGASWTAGPALPGGDFPHDGVPALTADLCAAYPFLDEPKALRLARGYGTQAREILGNATAPADLGEDFGAGLTEAEVRFLMREQWARTAEDVLWRRSKLGLRLDKAQTARLDAFMAAARSATKAAAE
ncbi:MAG: glycerol-3-phosphate dehydrogenase [Pseudomonadota bacterium]